MQLYLQRGNHVPHSPVMYSYLIVELDSAKLFVDSSKVTPEVMDHLKIAGVELRGGNEEKRGTYRSRSCGKLLEFRSSQPGFLLIKLEDNQLVETVGIPVTDHKGSVRLTACVSSQVGCPLRCSFCATGKGGFATNLKAHEIVEQVLAIEEVFNNRVTNVVFMGMGEPMLNLKEVLAAHRCLNKVCFKHYHLCNFSFFNVSFLEKSFYTSGHYRAFLLSLLGPNHYIDNSL
ncbi:putative 23S rRNA (adenine(2503)-C(2))-methyltransferase [Helianthus debilis subsp. tardiflorus]